MEAGKIERNESVTASSDGLHQFGVSLDRPRKFTRFKFQSSNFAMVADPELAEAHLAQNSLRLGDARQ